MTANLQEVTVTGPKWLRCNRIVVENPDECTPLLAISTEYVAALDDGTRIRKAGPSITVVFEPTNTVPLVDRETLAPLGTSMTHDEIYNIMFSLVVQQVTEQAAAANSTQEVV